MSTLVYLDKRGFFFVVEKYSSLLILINSGGGNICKYSLHMYPAGNMHITRFRTNTNIRELICIVLATTHYKADCRAT